jgi:hypothetical protein
VQIFVFAFFAIFVSAYVLLSGDTGILIWAVPTIILLLLIPMGMTYLSQSQYADLIPEYEAFARELKIREINESLISKPITFEGLVEEVRWRSLNRPHYIIADKTGETIVKMFTSPSVDVRKDDVVRVYGQVIRRYIFAGDPIVNGVDIRIIKKNDKKSNSGTSASKK